MKKFPVVLDIETQRTFREVADPQKLGVSVAVLYDYADHSVKSFFEQEISQLFPYLENASYIVGYNVRSFDIPVLQAYYPGKVENFSVFDIIDEVRNALGRRLALNDLIQATLNQKKSGHGLMAIEYFRAGRLDELKQYCTDDVLLTKALFEHGVNTGVIHYFDDRGKMNIQVNWKKYLEDSGSTHDMPLTLPF